MRAFIVICVLTCLGCTDRRDTAIELERQKLALATLERQQEVLAEVEKKKEELRESEKKNAERLQAIATQEADLKKREAGVETRITELRSRHDEITKVAAKNESLLAQLKGMAERSKEREPFLRALANETADILCESKVVHPSVREPTHFSWYTASQDADARARYGQQLKDAHYNDCLRALGESNVILIEDNTEFEAKAVELMEQHLRLKNANEAALDQFKKKYGHE